MEGVDIPRVVVPGEGVNPLAHLVGGFICKSDAQDIAGQDAQLVHQIGEAVGQSPGLPGTRPGDDPDKALGGGDCLPLGRVQLPEDV